MNRYDDILHLPRHVSQKRAPMSLQDRAAQFSPFAALTGYDGVIAETGRLTERRMELDEYSIQQLDRQLKEVLTQIDRQPTVTVTWFQPDERKHGGRYETKTGPVRKLDTVAQILLFADGTVIDFTCITALQLHCDEYAEPPG